MLGCRSLLPLGFLSLLSAGCTIPCHSTTGWSFQVGRPATMVAPAAIAQGPSNLAMYPVAAYPSSAPPHGASMAAMPADCCPTGGGVSLRPGPGGPTLAAMGPHCDLDEICNRLERIERRMNGTPGTLSMPRPMPSGPAASVPAPPAPSFD